MPFQLLYTPIAKMLSPSRGITNTRSIFSHLPLNPFNLLASFEYIKDGVIFTLTNKFIVWLGALFIISACIFLVFDIESPEPLTEKEAVNMSFMLAQSLSYLQMGGDYQEGEYQSFMYENYVYRYLSSPIDTENEWIQYLLQSMTIVGAQGVFNEQNLILHNGKLAQIEADGGSLLEWNKSTAVLTSQSENTVVYKIKVPLGETEESETFHVTFKHDNKTGWRINELPISAK